MAKAKATLSRRQIEVVADWQNLGQPSPVGSLFATQLRGKESFEFHYDSDWLKSAWCGQLDPDLFQFSGPQYPNSKANFGVFLDSSPDRWGRFLQDRRETLSAAQEGRERRKLLPSDYLLGVYDEHRMGGLRFRLPDGPFLDDDPNLSAPPWTSLRELEEACRNIESQDADLKPDYQKWLRMLIAPGGSLGGARPKAGVIDPSGHLWIAKFPSRLDHFDSAAWEFLVHQMAEKAGIEVAPAQLKRFNSDRHTFLTKRFDRPGPGQRQHFASAMTLLGRCDGDDHTNGASYLELAELIIRSGSQTTLDLEQLWTRILFFVAISNADDHLRNHGFLWTTQGWKLSPCYDMNPDPLADGLKLNISEGDNSQSLELVLSVAPLFRITSQKAKSIQDRVADSIKDWKLQAEKIGLSRHEINQIEPAFRHFR